MAVVSGIYGIDPKQAVAHVKVFPRPGTLRQMEKSKDGAREGLFMRKAIDAERKGLGWTRTNLYPSHYPWSLLRRQRSMREAESHLKIRQGLDHVAELISSQG